MRHWLIVFTLLIAAGWTASSSAGEMTHAELVKRFPQPYIIGEKDSAIPVWPIFKQNATANELVGYVFESIDLAPISGFSGLPINLLIALDPKGNFIDVSVLSHHEPVFLDGLGEAPMFQFVSQYKGLSLFQNIKIETQKNNTNKPHGVNVYLDGVTKATASVRIMNQTVLSAALKVARKKLGFAEGRDPDLIARVKKDYFVPASIAQLIDSGLIKHLVVRNREVEQKFKSTNGAGLDPDALAQPDATFIDLYLALVSVPGIGRNLLDLKSWGKLKNRLEDGDHAILVMTKGRYGILSDTFVSGTIPDRLQLQQDKLPIEMRDLDLDLALASNSDLKMDSIKVFRVISQSGLDPAHPLDFSLAVTRNRGIIYPERITENFPFSFELPKKFYQEAEADAKSWKGIWIKRWWEITLLITGLTALAIALTFQKRLTKNGAAFVWFRRGFLSFTLLFIGWYAQGQLSIVNITGFLQALIGGRSLDFFLYDPMTVVLWGFVAVSLVIWGRGTFCGWLCPFGALQEFIGKLAQLLRIPQLRIKTNTDARLKRIKYVVLFGILISTFISTRLTDTLVEVEPFKTAITLNFVRSWPYVVYAVGLLLASTFVYKFFCRYLCPFGAGLAVLGRFRLLDWIPRRKECGTPCQTCRHRCDYQAIKPDGKIVYEECFQCMDCVVIYESDDKCAPLIMEKKRARIIPIQPAPVNL
ncbi:4Fe-4S binding protein [Glaciimonas immobilis]|uniref:Transcriptional regulator of nitric oxide reductase n=1 Tax=Glaciimonas immobilis TaxID=728004 RepID=A0A840RUS2_9BURK|nr:4Fe-4S binding protein [Glaciimonas immobilis]KAF3998706.1 4Fe-4S binding protein [Glaciimonas immobilis]MBB5201585.1 transcriptional regulator of nitric oxide reductase [Glaciimonas immobilis]